MQRNSDMGTVWRLRAAKAAKQLLDDPVPRVGSGLLHEAKASSSQVEHDLLLLPKAHGMRFGSASLLLQNLSQLASQQTSTGSGR